MITRALYALMSSGAEWKKTFSDYMKHTLGYDPYIGVDDNIDTYPQKKMDDAREYYSSIIIYVNDVLCVYKDSG